MSSMTEGIEVLGPVQGRVKDEVLTPAALSFVAQLHRQFNPTREELLAARVERQARLDAGERPDFLAETSSIRAGDWRVAPVPADLQARWTEITGPVDRKMIINALNSGANVFMADFEDALSPTWENVSEGQVNLIDAANKTISLHQDDGRVYELKDEIATLLVRPRGWHLVEKNVLVDGQPISGSIFDFGLYFFHNARTLLDKGTGPYFYLAKLENHREARLWNDVFVAAQDALGIPQGSIKATVLIETILAAFEMDEILYELRNHIAGLNAGRWDYIFSVIKKFRNHADFVLPDRGQVTMTSPFMRAYTELLVKTCHGRGAHAIGGMSAFIPSRRDAEVNARALEEVRLDKVRETKDGSDGTWVAHPGLIPVAKGVFVDFLGGKDNQVERLRDDVHVTADDLLDTNIEGGKITETGLRHNISVGLQYLASWLRGTGAAAIYNLMEDVATAEISRAQIWQWVKHGSRMDDGRIVTADLVTELKADELEKIRAVVGDDNFNEGRFLEASELFDRVALGDQFIEFLTLPAYAMIN